MSGRLSLSGVSKGQASPAEPWAHASAPYNIPRVHSFGCGRYFTVSTAIHRGSLLAEIGADRYSPECPKSGSAFLVPVGKADPSWSRIQNENRL